MDCKQFTLLSISFDVADCAGGESTVAKSVEHKILGYFLINSRTCIACLQTSAIIIWQMKIIKKENEVEQCGAENILYSPLMEKRKKKRENECVAKVLVCLNVA